MNGKPGASVAAATVLAVVFRNVRRLAPAAVPKGAFSLISASHCFLWSFYRSHGPAFKASRCRGSTKD
jgi:hypothetical protein